MGAKNLAEGQKGLTLAAFIKILGPIIVVLPGIIAFHKWGGEILANNDVAYPRLVAEVLPTYLVGFFAVVMFGAILSLIKSLLHSLYKEVFRFIIRFCKMKVRGIPFYLQI